MSTNRAGGGARPLRLSRFVAGVLLGLALDFVLFASLVDHALARQALLLAAVLAVTCVPLVQVRVPRCPLRRVTAAACGASR